MLFLGFPHANLGSGTGLSIVDLTQLVCRVVGYEGRIVHDLSRPGGTPRKPMTVNKLRAMGGAQTSPPEAGVAATYHWFLEHEADGEAA